jgi:hypothetical protein
MMETSLTDMKTVFPQASEPIQGIPTLQFIIEHLFYLCHCAQTQRSSASATMNLLFCTAPPDVYAFLTAEAYPATFAPFLPIVPDVPNYTACTNNNKRATVKAMHTFDKKMRADNVTMNTTIANVFLEALSSQVRASFLQQHLHKLNIVFVNMFVWFVARLRRRIAKQTVSAWWPTGIPPTVLTHFSSASSPAWRSQDAPTSQWPTATLSTSASA